MTLDEHKALLTQILQTAAPEQQATASDLLTKLSDDYVQISTEKATAESSVQQLTENNETLRAVNAKLFLRVGETDAAASNQQQQEAVQTVPEQMEYTALFNEKGDLI